MPLETATYVSDLNATYPAHSDGLNQADAHIRMLKAALQATFPAVTGPLTSPTGQLAPGDGSATIPAYSFRSEPGLGFYRSGPSTMAYTGTLLGTTPVGAILDFGGTTAPYGYIACDGAALSRTTYSSLFAAIGTTWGAGDGSTTFNVPNLVSRFRRHREVGSYAGPVGTLQGPQNLSHTHTGSGTTSAVSNDHTHTYSGTTGVDSPDHTHNVTVGSWNNSSTGGGAFTINAGSTTVTTAGANQRHSHSFSGTTGGISANHTHTYGFTTSGGSADGSEARPFSATVLTCIRAV